jgi:hypothetical protein
VAVAAGLVAEFADVNLKDRDAGGVQREEAGLIEARLKCKAAVRFRKQRELPGGGSQRIVSAQQGQWHLLVSAGMVEMCLRNLHARSARMPHPGQSRFRES